MIDCQWPSGGIFTRWKARANRELNEMTTPLAFRFNYNSLRLVKEAELSSSFFPGFHWGPRAPFSITGEPAMFVGGS